MSDPEVPRQRVRVTSPQTENRTRPRAALSASTEIDDQTEVGLIFLGALLRTQLRLALGVLLTLVLTVGTLPLAFRLFPDLAAAPILGMPLAWCVLGFGVYPLLLLLGMFYVTRAEHNEDAFVAMIEGPAAARPHGPGQST